MLEKGRLGNEVQKIGKSETNAHEYVPWHDQERGKARAVTEKLVLNHLVRTKMRLPSKSARRVQVMA